MELQKATKRRYGNYAGDWESFLERSVQIIEEQPFRARFVLKYVPRKNTCVLKVTDGTRLVMRKTKQLEDFEKVENLIQLISKLLSNRKEWAVKEAEPERKEEKDKGKKKKKRGK